MKRLRAGLLLLLFLALAAPASAYIEALTTLKGLVQESDVIARGAVDAVSLEKKVLILRVGKTIKGKTVYERIRIDMGAGDAWHPDAALRHATMGSPVAIFYKKADNSDLAAISLIYLNRFFLTVQGGDPVWRFSKIELGMNRVYLGTPEELCALTGKVVSGRTKPPAPDARLKPYTKNILGALPPPPKEGEPWAAFDASKAFQPQDAGPPDPEGFLQFWLVAGPLKPDTEFPKGAPKEGDAVSGETKWQATQASAFSLELAAPASDSRFLGVSYLVCDQDTPDLRLAVGSDEPSTWWLNGEEVARIPESVALGKDQASSKTLVLKKGRNLLLMSLTSKRGPGAAACARFLDKEGGPFRGFTNDTFPR